MEPNKKINLPFYLGSPNPYQIWQRQALLEPEIVCLLGGVKPVSDLHPED
jgi:hypothetical protein